ncbi:probable E3 ubiquitin-protein ligase RHA4A [Manihot esculenta]|uniref:RING-type E3 ubiquitin transferase n=1 Tax=Manihot esculenta TaxID=3983 RepID=A0A2C9W9T8_MANES|nr:probable E3 ubiquitin-protein ligase RHA4A [Manihot esculenta]OAY56325.1 hypothetical protein MANES_02G007100v8 [Manihot esculenta]
MGFTPTATPPHLYPQELQLKLYQAFIFSIPILFSIILFLLFYLFYLKRRPTSVSSPTQILPTSSNQSTQPVLSVCQIGLKKEIKDKLPIVLFDEELKTRESQCCVCLGEFEIKEELLQIPSCKHVFHIECIHHWLHSNSTCPLCRSFVIPTTKLDNLAQSGGHETPIEQDNPNSNYHTQIASEQQQQQQQAEFSHSLVIPIEESSSAEACSMASAGSPELSISTENGRGCSSQESVAINIQT